MKPGTITDKQANQGFTARERVLRAIAHHPTDIIPYHVEYTVPAKHAMVAQLGTTDLAGAIGDHLARYSTRCGWDEIRPGFVRDEFGVIWNRTEDPDVGIPQPVLATPSLAGYEWPDPRDPRRMARLSQFLAENTGRFTCIGLPFSLFERAWALRGMEVLLVDMLDNPAFVDALLDRLLEHNLAILDSAAGYSLDGVWFGDDWGQQKGLITGPRLWRRFILPRVREMYAAARRRGWKVIIHSCGDVSELLPDLIEAGVDVLNPFQPEVMDLLAVKREYGKDLAFCGGMSVQQILPLGTPAQVRETANWLLTAMGREGGYIFAPAHAIPGDVPVENLVAMLEVICRQVG